MNDNDYSKIIKWVNDEDTLTATLEISEKQVLKYTITSFSVDDTGNVEYGYKVTVVVDSIFHYPLYNNLVECTGVTSNLDELKTISIQFFKNYLNSVLESIILESSKEKVWIEWALGFYYVAVDDKDNPLATLFYSHHTKEIPNNVILNPSSHTIKPLNSLCYNLATSYDIEHTKFLAMVCLQYLYEELELASLHYIRILKFGYNKVY